VRLTSGADRSAGGWGRGASVGTRGGWAALGRERRGTRAREGGGEGGPESAQPRRGESFPFFSFCFLFSFSLIPFLLYPNIHLCFLGAKMKYYM
jgi:hypothetical protein